MRHTILFLTILAFSLKVQAQDFSTTIIKQSQLVPQLGNKNLVIIHVGRADGYTKGHIPGAVYMGNRDYTTVSHDSLYWELPESSHFKKALADRGVSSNSQVIICSDWESFAPAFRLYFTFDYFGMADQVRILDGGIKGWAYKGLEISTDSVISHPSSGDLVLNENRHLLVDKNWIRDNFNNENVQLIDARTPEYYSGENDGEGNYKRPGHIAGAKNITWKTLVDENNFLLDEDSLKERFDKKGIGKEQSVINYCHVGLRASVLYTVGKCLGYSTLLYDGSYNEWDRLNDEYLYEQTKK